MNEKKQPITPNTKTDHINKQGMYVTMLKSGTSEKAKERFKRPPFYMTATNTREEIEDE